MYEVEYCNGYVAEMPANVISENLLAQVEQEGNRFLLIESIIDKIPNGTQTLQKDKFVIEKSGTKTKIKNNWRMGSLHPMEGWKYYMKKLKDIKYLYPVQMVEYAVENRT